MSLNEIKKKNWKKRKNGQTEKAVTSPIKHTTDPSNPGQ
jgi:hypothetical protein